MMERSYHLSCNGEGIAEETDLRKAINSLKTDITEEFTGWRRDRNDSDPIETLAQEVLASEYFEDLSDEEQREVLHNLNRFGRVDNLTWIVESEQREDTLLDMPQASKREKAVPTDLIVLIGAAALDFYETEESSWLESWREQGFDGKLEAARFATAVALEDNRFTIREKGGVFSYNTGSNTRRRVWVGGTLHGDFRISQRDVHPDGAVTPTGSSVEFAPSVEPTVVGAYHSVEPHVAESVIKHMYFTAPQEAALKEKLADVSNRIGEEEIIEVGNFADYGTENTRRIVKEFLEYKQHWIDRPLPLSEEGRILDRYILNPGRNSQHLKIVSFPDRLRYLQSFSQAESEEKDRQFIDIPNEHLDNFLVALHEQARSGAGRTSPTTIAALINAVISYEV